MTSQRKRITSTDTGHLRSPSSASKQEVDLRRSEIVAMFDDDIEAQAIVEGLLDNMRGEELRALTGLNETAYESKRRLIRRRIEKRKGVKP